MRRLNALVIRFKQMDCQVILLSPITMRLSRSIDRGGTRWPFHAACCVGRVIPPHSQAVESNNRYSKYSFASIHRWNTHIQHTPFTHTHSLYSHLSIHLLHNAKLQNHITKVPFSYGHTHQNTPDPVWSPKLSWWWLSQYCGGGPHGNTGCCNFCCIFVPWRNSKQYSLN